MTTWICRDDQGPEVLIEASSADEAAQEYVDQGDYGQDRAAETTWVDVRCTPARGAAEDVPVTVTVTLDPVPPACTVGHVHDWCAPYEVVGGIAENPGVWGHGGGVVCRRVCRHCGAYKVTDTSPQHPAAEVLGLVSTRYEDADEESLAWLRARRAP